MLLPPTKEALTARLLTYDSNAWPPPSAFLGPGAGVAHPTYQNACRLCGTGCSQAHRSCCTLGCPLTVHGGREPFTWCSQGGMEYGLQPGGQGERWVSAGSPQRPERRIRVIALREQRSPPESVASALSLFQLLTLCTQSCPCLPPEFSAQRSMYPQP